MKIQLGGELELKDVDIRASTLEARRIFLELIWKIKSDVVFDLLRLFNIEFLPLQSQHSRESKILAAKDILRQLKHINLYSIDLSKYGFKADILETPVSAYFEFLAKNQTPHLKSTDIIKETELLLDWKELQSLPNSEKLCKLLIQWAEKWNLNEEWCLDFAMDVIRIFKVKLIDDLSLTEDIFMADEALDFYRYEEFINNGSAWEKALLELRFKDVGTKYLQSSKLPKYPEFKFHFPINIYGIKKILEIKDYWKPQIFTKEEFKKNVEKQLWQKSLIYYGNKPDLLVGILPDINKVFDKFHRRIDKYISNIMSKYKNIAVQSPVKTSGDKHFRWLIEYQIPPFENYTDLSEKARLHRKTIKEGIKNVADLIGLQLRESQFKGRPRIK